MLVNRLDGFWGVDREGVPASPGGTPENRRNRYRDWLCRHARGPRAIQAATTTDGQVHYALDLGNTADSGQFIPGGPSNEVNRPSRTCLRTVAELYPALVDPQLDDDGQAGLARWIRFPGQNRFSTRFSRSTRWLCWHDCSGMGSFQFHPGAAQQATLRRFRWLARAWTARWRCKRAGRDGYCCGREC